MKTKASVGILATLVGFAVVGGFILKTQSQVGPPGTAAERISSGMFFGQRIVQVGTQPASEEESRILLAVLDNIAVNQYRAGLAELEEYLATLTNSAWAPSLHSVLGRYYYDLGRYTPALGHWELAWWATRNYPDGNGKVVADYTLAHWTRLLASLGRYEALTNLVLETQGRVLDRGRLSQKWRRTREAVTQMRLHPGMSYQCGTFAMYAVARELGLNHDASRLLRTPSPATGFSLATLTELSTQLGLGLVPVARVNGDELPVPSVIHWQQNHYAAILSQHGNLYKVADPTFGHPRYMTAETINLEASGYFLSPVSRLTGNFRWLGTQETSLVYGRGNPNFVQDADDQVCESCECPVGPGGTPNKGSPTGSPADRNAPRDDGGDDEQGQGNSGPTCFVGCAGMPVWRVSESYINLWLFDVPLRYQPALGDAISCKLSYKQRAEDDHRPLIGQFSNLGYSWYCSWLSMVKLDNQGNVYLNYAQGGEATFHQSQLVGQAGLGNYYNNLKLRAITNGAGECTSYELLYPNGAKDIYGTIAADPYYNVYWYYYLSQKISPEGHATTFWYEFGPGGYKVWLKHVVDADGKTNTLHHSTGPYYETLITQIDDPYGRSIYFQYDYDGSRLTNIIDTASLGTTFIYDDSGWITNMTTPYGPTSFQLVDAGALWGYDAWDRTALITQPNGGHQLYALIQNWMEIPDYGVEYYPAAQVPTNTPIGTLENTNLWSRNSYHWGPLQYSALSTTDPLAMTTNDFLKARMRHWLGEAPDPGNKKSMDTLSMERDYSPDGNLDGQKTWYDYPNKGPDGPGDKGYHILPEVVARVLPNGSTWYEWARRNAWGQPTNVVETYTQPNGTVGLRTNHFVYAANGQDLVLHIGPQGEQVVSNYFGNSYHQVDASYDALNQETKYTYNANRQLTSIRTPGGLTTTNLYFTSGDALNRLQKTIDLEIARTNSYTYSGDLVYSHTDERGLTVTNYWDGLSRLTGRKYPDGTTTSNIYSALDITATKDRMGFWSYAEYNGIRQKVAETNANGVVTRYGLCDCGAVMSVTNAWNTPVQMVTSFGYDLQGNRLYTYFPDATVTNWYDSLRRVIVTGDAWGYRWFNYNNQGLLTSVVSLNCLS
ncbi:MAG TPA: cysteine peptidase family C39 domain-containing protein [Verrucomicrobiae bacterium]|nr:cysteine peptidase family C39 domain-containing protein [Verrucomicrobiae bacterium]